MIDERRGAPCALRGRAGLRCGPLRGLAPAFVGAILLMAITVASGEEPGEALGSAPVGCRRRRRRNPRC